MKRTLLPALLVLALAACAHPGRAPEPSVERLVEERRTASLDARAAEQQYTDRLERVFDGETRDTQWADRFETDLRRAAEAGLPAGALAGVECRSTRCMVEFAPDAATGRQQAQGPRSRLPASAGMLAWLSAAQPCGFYAPAPAATDTPQPLRAWILCEDDRASAR